MNFHDSRWRVSWNFYAAPFTFCHTLRVWRLLSFIFLHTVLVIVLPHFCGLTCIAQRLQLPAPNPQPAARIRNDPTTATCQLWQMLRISADEAIQGKQA